MSAVNEDVAVRRIGPFDPCWVRDLWITDSAKQKALAQPVTRRLLVDGVGHYVDRAHGHIAGNPRGVPYTAVFICVSGAGWITIGDVRRRVTPGSAFLVPAGVAHAYGPTDLPWSIWWCTLVGSDTRDLLRSIGVSTADPVIGLRDTSRLVRIIDEIGGIYERQDPSSVLEAAGIAWRLLTRMSADRMLAHADPVEQAKDYLAEHFDEWVRVGDLASRVRLSPSRLGELFRAATGRSILAYQIELRMARARLLLEETDESVAGIARQVGYTDPDYFSRHFSRVNGVSATAYRSSRDPR